MYTGIGQASWSFSFCVCMCMFQIMDIMANWRGFCCVLAVGESACRFWSPWGQSSKCGVCYRPTRTTGNPSTLSLTSLVTSSYQFWKIMLSPLRKLPFQDQDVHVCVCSGSRARGWPSWPSLGSRWGASHSQFFWEHCSGEDMPLLQWYRYSNHRIILLHWPKARISLQIHWD